MADIPSEWPRIEAEREARIRADERARIVAYLRRAAESGAPGDYWTAAAEIEAGRHTEGRDGR